MARYTNEPEQLDDCGQCTLLPTATGWVRAVQVSCPEHSGHPAVRVRTQAERDADGLAWRVVADSRPGYATYPSTAPGSPSWWRRDLLGVRTADGRLHAPQDVALVYPGPTPVDGETCTKWCGFCHLGTEPAPPQPAEQPPADRSWIEMTAPRRRWWHRYTRRNP